MRRCHKCPLHSVCWGTAPDDLVGLFSEPIQTVSFQAKADICGETGLLQAGTDESFLLPTLLQASRLKQRHRRVTHSPLPLVRLSDRSVTRPPSSSAPTFMPFLSHLHVYPTSVLVLSPQCPDHPCCFLFLLKIKAQINLL